MSVGLRIQTRAGNRQQSAPRPNIVDAFQILRITQKKFQPHHEKRIVIRTIIDGAPACTDDLDSEGLLNLLGNVKGVARLSAEAGQIGDDQVVDVPVVPLDKGVQLDKIRSVEISGADPLVDKTVDPAPPLLFNLLIVSDFCFLDYFIIFA